MKQEPNQVKAKEGPELKREWKGLQHEWRGLQRRWQELPITEGMLEVAFALTAIVSTVVLITTERVAPLLKQRGREGEILIAPLVMWLAFLSGASFTSSYLLYTRYLEQKGIWPSRVRIPLLQRFLLPFLLLAQPYGWLILTMFGLVITVGIVVSFLFARY